MEKARDLLQCSHLKILGSSGKKPNFALNEVFYPAPLASVGGITKMLLVIEFEAFCSSFILFLFYLNKIF